MDEAEKLRQVRADIVFLTDRLPLHELAAIKQVCERLKMGLDQYGPLVPRKKAWRKEAKEEALDATIYLALELLEDQ